MNGPLISRIVLWIAAGAALGAGFFALLGLNARLYGGRRWPAALVLHLARWALLAATLLVAARTGAVPLLSVTAGISIARLVVVRRTCAERP